MKVYHKTFSALYNHPQSIFPPLPLLLFPNLSQKSSHTLRLSFKAPLPFLIHFSQFSSHLIYFVCYANLVSRPINQLISRGGVAIKRISSLDSAYYGYAKRVQHKLQAEKYSYMSVGIVVGNARHS